MVCYRRSTLYPDARFEVDVKGMKLFNSLPPVKKRLVQVGGVQFGALGYGSVGRPRHHVQSGALQRQDILPGWRGRLLELSAPPFSVRFSAPTAITGSEAVSEAGNSANQSAYET